MAYNEAKHQQVIEAYLTLMHHNPDHVLSYHLLREGISGAYTYQIRFLDETCILKLTLQCSGLTALERARREIAFYQNLANRIPLRVPRMVATHTDSVGTALLLEAYQSSPPPEQWKVENYLEVAQQLGKFHATFWKKTDGLSHYLWLRKQRQELMIEQMQQAYGYWQTLREQQSFQEILTKQEYAWLCAMVSCIPRINAMIQSLPMTLCHGDCNTWNVLRDTNGNFIWADWQEVGFGYGPEDLSFFLQQASIAGGMIPYEDALATYQEYLQAETNEDIPLVAIRRAVDAAALWTDVLYWPAYLAQASAQQLTDLLHRIHDFADRLAITPSL